MELRHLRTIVAVAHHRSLTKAGEQLYLTQSAISQQISRLEQELGVEVFRRTTRSVELTDEGRVILGYAERVLAEVDGMHGELEELSGLLRGELRIGGAYPTGPYDLFGMLADFRAAHPGVAIHMLESTQDDVLAGLRSDDSTAPSRQSSPMRSAASSRRRCSGRRRSSSLCRSTTGWVLAGGLPSRSWRPRT